MAGVGFGEGVGAVLVVADGEDAEGFGDGCLAAGGVGLRPVAHEAEEVRVNLFVGYFLGGEGVVGGGEGFLFEGFAFDFGGGFAHESLEVAE